MLEYFSDVNLKDGPTSVSESITESTLQSHLLAYVRILRASPSFARKLSHPWRFAPLMSIYQSCTAEQQKASQLDQSQGEKPQYSTPTRLLALWCCALGLPLSDAVREDATVRFIGSPSTLSAIEPGGVDADFVVQVGQEKKEKHDAWVIIEKESLRIQAIWNRCQDEPVSYRSSASTSQPQQNAMEVDQDSLPHFSISDLHPRVVKIGGVLALRAEAASSSAKPLTFVETHNISHALTDLAIDISWPLPILLSGPPASGKSSLIHHLHAQLYPKSSPQGILTIPLGDSTGLDAKSLLGSYTSSPTEPGTFVWREGSLARAVRKGYWVILEDVDRASIDVLAIIKELVKGMSPNKHVGHRPSLSLGTRGKAKAADGFRLFGIRSAEQCEKHTRFELPKQSVKGKERAGEAADDFDSVEVIPATFFGHKHWAEVVLPAPTSADVSRIIENRFPQLHASQRLAGRLVRAWEQLQVGQTDAARSSGIVAGHVRKANLRDLLKWCDRVEEIVSQIQQGQQSTKDPLANPIYQERIFLDGMDIFLGALPA